MKKDKLKVNFPIFTGETVLDFIKILLHKFYYDYITLKWDEKMFKFFYTVTERYANYGDIVNEVEQLDISNYDEKKRRLPTGRNKKVIVLMRDE